MHLYEKKHVHALGNEITVRHIQTESLASLGHFYGVSDIFTHQFQKMSLNIN